MIDPIPGREAELTLARELFAGLPDGPRALAIEGERGIGKSALWRAAVAEAAEHGCRVLACTARAGQLPFAGLADLLAGLEHEHLPPPQRDALEKLRASQALAVGVGVRGLLVALAPVVVAIDDVQWLDDSTAGALGFALRRVGGRPVGVIVAGRPPEHLLERVTTLALGPVPLMALRELLEQRLGEVPAPPRLRRLAELSTGNPLVALELMRCGWEPGAALPDALRGSIDGAARDALLAAAALARPTAELVEAASSAAALSAAEDAGAIIVDADGVRIARPLDGHAVYAATAPERRRALHRRLSSLVADPEEHARQLALATDPPNRCVAATLEAAAGVAEARDDWEAAGDLFERAAAFEPSSSRLAVRAADHLLRAGDAPRARPLLERVLADAPYRVHALRRLAAVRLQYEGVACALDLLEQAWAISDRPATACAVELDVAELLLDHRGDGAAIAPAVECAERAGDPASLARARTLAALAAGGDGPPAERVGDPARARTLAGLAAGGDSAPAERTGDQAHARTLAALAAGGDGPPEERAGDPASPARARTLVAPAVGGDGQTAAAEHPDGVLAARLKLGAGRIAEARADLLALRRDDAPVVCRLAWIALLGGDPEAAEAQLHVAALADGDLDRALVFALQAQVHAQRGDAAATRAAADAAIERCARLGSSHALPWACGAVALVELARGDHAAAWKAATGAPSRPLPLSAPGLEALIALGRAEEAERLLDQAVVAGPWDRAVLLRCRALQRASAGDGAGAFEALDRALAEHDQLELPFELARTLLVHGRLLRSARRKAEAHQAFERALTLLEAAGARAWAEVARAERSRTRPRAPGLTPAERRVTERAARGLANKEIALALDITVHTVEVHLSHAYAKLGIRKRTQLAARLADGVSEAGRPSRRSP